jgi:hypothetical protein
MTDIKYTEPDRSNHKPQQDAQREHFPEIDMGGKAGVFDDGRPYKAEFWFDVEFEVFAVTFFYSVNGIEKWGEDDHLEYLKQYDLSDCQAEEERGSGAGIKIIDDAAGAQIWSVTIVLRDDS